MRDAAVVMEGGKVAWVGPAREAPAFDTGYDVGGRAVIPGFVDSHSHLVFAGDRSEEFAARMTGTAYSAGGIRTTVAATRAASDEQLAANLVRLAAEMRSQGTTTLEVKSGYGLTVRDEARSLAIARQVTDETTFLGAHVVPPEHADDPAGYVDLVTGPMLDACAEHAKWIDVFCERGAFDEDQARAILQAGKAKGLGGRLHANQLGPGPGVRLACELGLNAVDHCTYLADADIDALVSSGTTATLLPGVEFSTRSPYPDARRLSTPACTSHWPPTATPARASRPRCRCASRWRCGRWACHPRRRWRPRPRVARVPSAAPTSVTSAWVPVRILRCSTPRRTSTWPTAPVSRWCARRSCAAAGSYG